ncbi:MAG: ATP-dependent protease subunit HslV [Deltaproteobacteria bacterium]|nr:ATP-dependent protease subunit HslV [Deltaproteobacteria bacterium]
MKPHGTTILAVSAKGRTAIAGDGQVTMGDNVVKHGAKKVRRLFHDKVAAGFAGATADALNLFDRFEAKLEQYNGNLSRAAVELARDWRTDKVLRRLEAVMIAADKDTMLLISGNGDVIEPDEGVMGIGSGGAVAQAAATALLRNTDMDAPAIVRAAMEVAASLCIYTNDRITMEML